MNSKQNEKFVRQPAIRLFAAELAESKQTIVEHIEGRDFDSLYQVTPTGVKVKRVLMMGALVEVDNIGTSGEYLRGRIIDPTGAFTVYAGQYQPEALIALSGLSVPCFVAVVGKTAAYRPDEETTIVSIRAETIAEIDAKTRDYWVKETVAKTLERVEKSQLPEAEKVKFRQMCKDALTELVNMPPEIRILLHKTPKEPVPHREEKIPESPAIEKPAIKDIQPDDNELKEKIFYLMVEASNKEHQKAVSFIEIAETAKKILGIEESAAIDAIKRLMNEGKCYEIRVGFLHPIVNEEKPPATLSASASEKQSELEPLTSADALPKEEHKDQEPADKIVIASMDSSSEEQTEPENRISETPGIQERKESKRINPKKARIRKKKGKPANNNQKTLFTDEPGEL